MLLTIRPAVGEAVEEGLVDVIVGEEEREDSAGLAAASRAIRRLIRRAFKIARLGEVGRLALEAVNRRDKRAVEQEAVLR
jgi:predicted deacetylase